MNMPFKEVVSVVNEKDKVVGRTTLAESHKNRQWHRIVHVLVFNNEGRLLLQKRGKSEALPLFWDASVGGHVEASETYVQAAVKECREELGLENFKLAPLFKFFHEGATANHVCRVFSCILSGSLNPHATEVEELRFASWSEIEGMRAKGEPFTQTFLKTLEKFAALQRIKLNLGKSE